MQGRLKREEKERQERMEEKDRQERVEEKDRQDLYWLRERGIRLLTRKDLADGSVS